MRINGLHLPPDFVQDAQKGLFFRSHGSWLLFQDQNAFGEPLETELADVFMDQGRIQHETDTLPQGFTSLDVKDVEVDTNEYGVAPGELSYIWDFSQIVCFAIAGDGAPFCFDFRENAIDPSVIWWADAYWQRIAPTYREFILLFDIPRAT